MTQQYIRKVSLTFGSASGALADLSELQFKFKVQRGDYQTPNTADIRIYNVSDQTANILQKEFTSVTLQAGYVGSFGVIFNGNIKQVRRGRENATDTYLDVTAADGDGAYNFAVVNTSLKAGSTPAQHVAAIGNSMAPYGVSVGNISGLPTQALPRGKVIFGLARDPLRTIAGSAQATWSIQNGQLQMVPLNNFLPSAPIVITSATGMVGLPEQTLDGIKVRTLLNPNIKISAAIQIDNRAIQQFRFDVGLNSAVLNAQLQQSIHLNADGLYKVLWVDYEGDTRGNDFYSDITCIAIDAQLGQNQIKNPRNVIAPGGPPAPIQPYGPGNTFPQTPSP